MCPQALAPALSGPASPLAPAAPGDAKAEADAVWALRYVAQLAASWPLGLLREPGARRAGAAGFGGAAQGAGAPPAAPASALRAAWKARLPAFTCGFL